MKNKIKKLLGIILVLGVFSGCKQYDNPPPVFEELKDLVGKQRKVLVISIDGVSGPTIRSTAPANIAALQKESKYSYGTLKTISDAGGWVSMLTGTGFVKHKISADNFERTIDDEHEDHGSVTSYRNVLDYITQYKAVRTAIVTPWTGLRNYVRNADYAPIVDSDLKVKDSTINLLNTVPSLSALFVNFRAAHEAGEQGGYAVSNTAYKDAITQSDQYIGEILAAMRARANFDKEDWLVIVTTNLGGGNDDAGNGFVLLNNPAFKEFELKKSGFNSVLFNPSTVYAEVPNDQGLYDAGATKDFTVQMDVRFNSSVSWPGFLSKSTNMSGSTFTGWLWMQSGANWNVAFGGTQNGGTGKNQISSANGAIPLNDGQWHTLTMVVKTTGGATPTARTMTAFVDGVQTITGSLLNNRSLTVTDGLRVGYKNVDNGGTGLSTYSANLAYFDKALDATTIANTHGLKDITQHPDYANLIGFWPMDEGTEGTFYNHAPGGYNMSLTGAYNWSSLGENFPPNTLPESSTSSLSIVTSASDIAALTLYWMNIEILGDFGFDGSAYLKNFEIEFLKD
jgi:hypothetical protein